MQHEGLPPGPQSTPTELKVAAAPSWTPEGDSNDVPNAPNAPKKPAAATRESARRVPINAWFVRWLAISAGALAIGGTGWQIANVVDGDTWSGRLSLLTTAAAVVAGLSVLAWTWIIVENARRLLSIASTHEPPDPMQALAAWIAPFVVAAAAGLSIVFLHSRLSATETAEASPVPLAIALAAIIVTMLVMYRPLYVLSGVTRRLGFASVELARWYWVPVALAIVGSLSLIALNLGGAYGDDFDGVAPAWALGVVAVPPTLIVFGLAIRGGRSVEDAVSQAFDRRAGKKTTGVGRGRMGFWARALRADARPPIDRDLRQRIRLLPGTDVLRLAVVTSVAALALLSIVGAIIMFLFWREASNGVLLQSQQDRAWDTLASLQRVERSIAALLLVVVTIWAFVSVMNVRLATGRRRNPILAAIAWPAAAFGIWRVAERIGDDERIGAVVTGFVLQALILLVPFFLLERAAVAVAASRQPIRFAYGIAVILLVHTQGLVGLSTLDNGSTSDEFGRLAGYLALAALIQLVGTLAITESSHLVAGGARHEADQHNFLAAQRRDVEERATAAHEAKAAAEAARTAEHAAVESAARQAASHAAPGGSGSRTTIAASSPPQF
ncbi:hypothetical protein [Ilumatobacter coccineus]|uniref:Uncharacterized protein n=1 Tax=Ilumatobacter coccineus (strain NBRC 103263 / KCTC 29153 / YM16-304) TaxID=1313172 RepID=A0A6C7EEM8_ILUCY|nr:hypothetical protein [Ilumatobacter coccineus]BAN03629.1 hypothetical protein YM304_33150 [Ilumatobacter coccineus YM16-304]